MKRWTTWLTVGLCILGGALAGCADPERIVEVMERPSPGGPAPLDDGSGAPQLYVKRPDDIVSGRNEKELKEITPMTTAGVRILRATTPDSSDEPADDPTQKDEGQENGVNMSADIEPLITKLIVEIKTHEQEKSGTDSDISIQFCRDSAYTKCGNKIYLDNVGEEFEVGDVDTFTIGDLTASTEKDVRYFRIIHDGGGRSPMWLLQGIKVSAVYENSPNDTHVIYHNPCVLRWHEGGRSILFGPDDTAVCLFTHTTAEHGSWIYDGYGSWSSDDVVLEIDIDDDDVDAVTGSIYPKNESAYDNDCIRNEGPCFRPLEKSDRDVRRSMIQMNLDWKNHNDHERDERTSYGNHLFDFDLIEALDGLPSVRIRKEKKNDDWRLSEIGIVMFKPSLLADDGGVCHYAIDRNEHLFTNTDRNMEKRLDRTAKCSEWNDFEEIGAQWTESNAM